MESCLNQSGQIDAGVDWSAPWLAGLRDAGRQVAAAHDWREALNRRAELAGLKNQHGHAIRFVAQQELPPGLSYEAYINDTGRVPTRENLHDFFNALVWLTYARLKIQLNTLQAAQIARLGIGKSRGPSRDAATLFDENAAILAVTANDTGQALVTLLQHHQWNEVFVRQRAQFMAHAEVVLFGHAIMEKLVQPYKAITAHTLVCWVDADFHELDTDEKIAILDAKMALQLASCELQTGIFSPLPVLGVPGWWPEQNPQFYADASVFRPERLR
jgi:hypothetical protein